MWCFCFYFNRTTEFLVGCRKKKKEGIENVSVDLLEMLSVNGYKLFPVLLADKKGPTKSESVYTAAI